MTYKVYAEIEVSATTKDEAEMIIERALASQADITYIAIKD